MGNLIRNIGALGTLGGECRMLGNGGINVGGGRFRGNGPVCLGGLLIEFSDGGSTGSAVFKQNQKKWINVSNLRIKPVTESGSNFQMCLEIWGILRIVWDVLREMFKILGMINDFSKSIWKRLWNPLLRNKRHKNQ